MSSVCLTFFSPYFIEVLCILMDKAPRRASVWVAYKGRSSHQTGEICCFSSGGLGPFPASREDAVSGPARAVSLFPNIHPFCVQTTSTSPDARAGQTASYQVCTWRRAGRETRQGSKTPLSYTGFTDNRGTKPSHSCEALKQHLLLLEIEQGCPPAPHGCWRCLVWS